MTIVMLTVLVSLIGSAAAGEVDEPDVVNFFMTQGGGENDG